ARRSLGDSGVRQRQVERIVDVTGGAVAAISHVADFVVVVHRLVVAHDGKILGQFGARVDLVDHALEVDGFRCVVGGTLGRVGGGGVLAHHAKFHTLTIAAVVIHSVVALGARLLCF